MTDYPITEFKGVYRWLSNFWPVQVELDTRVYPTVENAYQAAKFPELDRDLFCVYSPAEAKAQGRTAKLPPEWEVRKLPLMQELVARKFAPGTPLAGRLVATGTSLLEESNTWNDRFWGVCGGHGENHLGRILMAQRDVLCRSEI